MSFITNIEKDEDEITFTINSQNKFKTGFINGLRRTMISDIPINSISTEKINFINNTCMFDNEFLKHRLGLVSIRNNTLEDLDDVLLSIDKTNTTDEMISVYMSDFTVTQRDKPIKNEEIIKYPKTLLTKLKPSQHLKLDTTLQIGIGREDARFSPVSTAFYHFEYDDDERNYKKDTQKYPLKYIFTIESSGQLEPKQILLTSINLLQNRLNNIKNDINNKSGKFTEFKKSPTKLDAIDIHLINETDTVGNLLTQYIMDVPDIKYSGYHMPHPFKKLLILRFSYKDNSIETITKLISDNIDNINKLLDEFKNECEKL